MSKIKELKCRVDDVAALFVRLQELGAIRVAHLHVRNVYFNQPEGDVLKISEDETGNFLVRLRQVGAGFDLISNDMISDVAGTRNRLRDEYGEKSELVKEEEQFAIPDRNYELILTTIEDRGSFAVIRDIEPDIDAFINDLGIEDPELITVPFDELPARRP